MVSDGINEFSSRVSSLTNFNELNEKAINPMSNGLKSLNNGILELKKGLGDLGSATESLIHHIVNLILP